MWKSLTMLNEKVATLEKQHDADRAQVDVLRSEVWETRQKLFISQDESAKLTADLSRKEEELARSKETLAKTDAELNKTRNALLRIQQKLNELEQSKDVGTTSTDAV
jgi:septal ring factor EnvC (AmiA/AmiB activator)